MKCSSFSAFRSSLVCFGLIWFFWIRLFASFHFSFSWNIKICFVRCFATLFFIFFFIFFNDFFRFFFHVAKICDRHFCCFVVSLTFVDYCQSSYLNLCMKHFVSKIFFSKSFCCIFYFRYFSNYLFLFITEISDTNDFFYLSICILSLTLQFSSKMIFILIMLKRFVFRFCRFEISDFDHFCQLLFHYCLLNLRFCNFIISSMKNFNLR